MAKASELAQRARSGGGSKETPEEKEAKQLRMKLGSLGGSIEILTDEEKTNPYILQPLVGAHAELTSKDRKMQADTGKVWENALKGLKSSAGIQAYITKNKITDSEHLRNFLLGTAESFVNGRKSDLQKGTKGQPRLIGTYAFGVQRNTEKWLKDNSEMIDKAFEAKDKLDVGSSVVDKDVEIKNVKQAFQQGHITRDEANRAIAEYKKAPDAMDLAKTMTKDQILAAVSPEIMINGIRLQKVPDKEVRREIFDRVRAGTMTQQDADLWLAKVDKYAPMEKAWTLDYPKNTSGKKYDPNTLQEIK